MAKINGEEFSLGSLSWESVSRAVGVRLANQAPREKVIELTLSKGELETVMKKEELEIGPKSERMKLASLIGSLELEAKGVGIGVDISVQTVDQTGGEDAVSFVLKERDAQSGDKS